MRLIDAFRLEAVPRLALIGAGGKSSLLFRLGREYHLTTGGPVFLSATTHLAVDQTELADFAYHFRRQPGNIIGTQIHSFWCSPGHRS